MNNTAQARQAQLASNPPERKGQYTSQAACPAGGSLQRRQLAHMLEHVVQVAQPWLEHYGYAALFGALFLEAAGIPTLGLTMLIAAVLLASQGEMQIELVVGLALVATLSGCQLAYIFGRTGGRRLILRTGLLSRHHLHDLHRLFRRWGPPLLLAAPFVDGLRQYGSLAAGAAMVSWGKFTLYNAAGVVLWIGSWSVATDLFGQHLEPVLRVVHKSSPWIFACIATSLLGFILLRLFRKPHTRE
jgi:membrane protein DedA with SNARE-associated domain